VQNDDCEMEDESMMEEKTKITKLTMEEGRVETSESSAIENW